MHAYGPLSIIGGNDIIIKKNMPSIVAYKEKFTSNLPANKTFNNLDMAFGGGSQLSLNKQNSYNSFRSNNSNNNF